MTRGGESWYPLSGSNPVPGNPGEVRAAGRQYEKVAAQIQAASTDLRSIADGLTQRSKAIDEVQGKARRVASKIERAHQRYVAAGAALVTYASALEPAQQMAHEALRQAQRGAAARDDAQSQLQYLYAKAPDPNGVPSATAAQFDAARENTNQADHQVDEAHATLATAVAMRDAAAETATAAIHAVVSTDGLEDGFWQNVGNGITEIWNGLGEISAKLSMLALALCWFPVLDVFLPAADFIVATLLLVRDTFNLVTGSGSGRDVALDTLGLITFGVGRVAAKGLTVAADAARASKGVRGAGTIAEESGEAMKTSVKAGTTGATSVDKAARSAVRFQAPVQFSKTREALGALKPKATLSDTLSDLSGPARVFQFPGAHPLGRHSLVSRVVSLLPVR